MAWQPGELVNTTARFRRLSSAIPSSYTVMKIGSKYYAECNVPGGTEYSGTDAATVIQAAMNALTSGGKIFLKLGVYNTSGGTLEIPATFNDALIIEGECQGETEDTGVVLESSAAASMVDALRSSGIEGHLHLKNLKFKHTTSTTAITTLDLEHINSYLENVFVEGDTIADSIGIKAGPSGGAGSIMWKNVHSEKFAKPFDLALDHLTGIGLTSAYAINFGFLIQWCHSCVFIEPHVFSADNAATAFNFVHIGDGLVLINPWQENNNPDMFAYDNVDDDITIISPSKDGSGAWLKSGYDTNMIILPRTVGYITENSSVTSAIATGATVTHGLAATPTSVRVTAAESGPTDIYVTAVGATTFVINYGGGGTKTFYWHADYKP